MSGGDLFEEDHAPHENHERYLLTYADMITLLMALFIILFAIGQTDVAKFKRFQIGLQKSFGAKLTAIAEEQLEYHKLVIEGIVGIGAGMNPRLLVDQLGSHLTPDLRSELTDAGEQLRKSA